MNFHNTRIYQPCEKKSQTYLVKFIEQSLIFSYICGRKRRSGRALFARQTSLTGLKSFRAGYCHRAALYVALILMKDKSSLGKQIIIFIKLKSTQSLTSLGGDPWSRQKIVLSGHTES